MAGHLGMRPCEAWVRGPQPSSSLGDRACVGTTCAQSLGHTHQGAHLTWGAAKMGQSTWLGGGEASFLPQKPPPAPGLTDRCLALERA